MKDSRRLRFAGVRLAAMGLGFVLAAGCGQPQQADQTFTVNAHAAGTAGTSTRARLLFDHAHQNFHRIDGRYRPFAELARSAGFDVPATERQFDRTRLDHADVLVIANALPEPGAPDVQTFSDREVDAIEGFVIGGGGLLLITDIPPWAMGAERLAARFGVRLSGGIVYDVEHRHPVVDGPGNLLFTRKDGLLGAHPILDGTSRADRVNAVATFRGQALFAPPDAAVLLRLPPHAEHVPIAISTVLTKFGPDAVRTAGPKTNVGGAAQAVALEHGFGRVVIAGEAAAFTAQVDRQRKFGMNLEGADNAQFVVNTLRWLSRR